MYKKLDYFHLYHFLIYYRVQLAQLDNHTYILTKVETYPYQDVLMCLVYNILLVGSGMESLII